MSIFKTEKHYVSYLKKSDKKVIQITTQKGMMNN